MISFPVSLAVESTPIANHQSAIARVEGRQLQAVVLHPVVHAREGTALAADINKFI
jgi:hypothetical protein